jgi:hypothetical protein
MDITGVGVPCTWSDLTNGEVCRRDLPQDAQGGPFPAPRADYDFYAPRDGNYYFHIRGQGGYYWRDRHIFWGIDGAVLGQESGFPAGPLYDGAVASGWDWRKLSKGEGGNQGDTVWLSEGNHTLHLWAGGPGFDVDRVIVSTDASLSSAERNLSPNNGRTGSACDPCDPRFGGRPGGELVCDDADPPTCTYYPDCSTDQRRDAVYDDEQPIRNALEAARHFVARLDPRLDQVGYVPYSTDADVANELECLRYRGAPNLESPLCNPDQCAPGQEPPCDPDCGCFAGVITNTVLYELDRTRAGGTTNIAHGIQLGIDVLSITDDHYGRPVAAQVMVLLTDGEANEQPNDYCDDQDLWPEGGGPKDCVLYYAQEALDKSILLYTISLGQSADQELMAAAAELTGGWHRYAPTTDDLDEIFDELYERIFLRLIH